MKESGEGKKELRSQSSWNRVYLAVVVTTIVVLSALWAFSRHFR